MSQIICSIFLIKPQYSCFYSSVVADAVTIAIFKHALFHS